VFPIGVNGNTLPVRSLPGTAYNTISYTYLRSPFYPIKTKVLPINYPIGSRLDHNFEKTQNKRIDIEKANSYPLTREVLLI